jgi:hypothetical protein
MTKVLPAPATSSNASPTIAIKEQEKGNLKGSEVVQISQPKSVVAKPAEAPPQNTNMKKVYAVALIIIGIAATIFALNILVGLTLILSGSTSASILATSLVTGVGKGLTGISALTAVVAGVWSIIKGYELWEEAKVPEKNLQAETSPTNGEELVCENPSFTAPVSAKAGAIVAPGASAGKTDVVKKDDTKGKAGSASAVPLTQVAAPQNLPDLLKARRKTIREVPAFLLLDQQPAIRIENQKIKVVPPALCSSKKVTVISFKNNELDSLPEEFGNLAQLQELDIEGNHLKKLPDSFSKLENLQKFNARNNELAGLPSGFSKFSKLQELDLSQNHSLKGFPKEIIECTQLTSLSLSSIKMSKVPSEIVKLVNLKTLDLSNNNLNELPKEFDQLKKLETLILTSNPFEVLPAVVGQLPNLKTLHIPQGVMKQGFNTEIYFPRPLIELLKSKKVVLISKTKILSYDDLLK